MRCWNVRNGHDVKVITVAEAEKAFHESGYILYRVPDDRDTDWAMEIVGMFETPMHLWDAVVRGVKPRNADVLLWYYRDGKTMREIAGMLGLSYQRIEQTLKETLAKVRKTVESLEQFRRMFEG